MTPSFFNGTFKNVFSVATENVGEFPNGGTFTRIFKGSGSVPSVYHTHVHSSLEKIRGGG